MMRRLVIGLLFALGCFEGASAGESLQECGHWSAGAETPVGKEIRISHVIELKAGLEFEGSSYFADLGGQARGLIDVEAMEQAATKDIAPSLFVAVVRSNAEYVAFSLPVRAIGMIALYDGDWESLRTGRLTNPELDSSRVVKPLADPIGCVRVEGREALVDVDEAIADGFEIAGFIDGKDPGAVFYRGGAGNEITSLFETEIAKEPVATPDAEESLTSVLSKSDETPKEPVGGLSELSAGVSARKPEEPAVKVSAMEPAEAKEAGEEPLDGPSSVCMLASERQLDLDGLDLRQSVYVAGLVKNATRLDSFTYEPLFDALLMNEGQSARILNKGETLAPVTLDGLRSYVVEAAGEVPVIPIGLPTLDIRVETGVEQPEVAPEDRLNVYVVGDAATVRSTGLSQLEQAATAKLGQIFWNVVWHDVKPNGSIGKAQNFGSMEALEKALPLAGEPVFLSTAKQFDRFIGDLERLALDAPSRIDQLYWIKEGYLLPPEAPLRVSKALSLINLKGNIARRENGNPLKWLQIIAGTYAQDFSRFYLEGPVKTVVPEVGSMSVEQRDGEREFILTDMTYPRSMLEYLTKRRGLLGDAPVLSDPLPVAELTFAMQNALRSVGFLIHTSILDDMSASVATTKFVVDQLREGQSPETVPIEPNDFDITAFLWPKTDEDGELLGLDLDARVTDRRLKTLKRAKPGYEATKAIDAIGNQIARSRGVMRSKGCDFVYISMKDANL